MDHESVIEFLGEVPLLQRLPSSSLRKIAEVVEFKHYDRGDYVVREGEIGDGIYFIWEGMTEAIRFHLGRLIIESPFTRWMVEWEVQAEVSEPLYVEEGNRPEINLRKYDYFGYGTITSIHQTNVIASTKLTCLVLHHQHSALLQSKSIWHADGAADSCSLVEQILHLEPIDVNIFRGFTLPDAPKFAQVFGGQFVGQALAAASKTVDCLKLVHSLHSYFLRVGDLTLPIIYQVHRLRDGNSFATRRVDAMQQGDIVFTLLASFQKAEAGFEHQEAKMPLVSPPEKLLSMEELQEKRLTDPRLPMAYRNKVARKDFVLWPIEMRFCELNHTDRQYQSHPSLKYWFKARGQLSDDLALHRCVVAYASDLNFLGVSLNPHRKRGLKTASLSLDHSMWFHRPFRADEWLLFVIESPSSGRNRGFVSGRMFNQKGELVISLTQEGVIRIAKAPNPPQSKL